MPIMTTTTTTAILLRDDEEPFDITVETIDDRKLVKEIRNENNSDEIKEKISKSRSHKKKKITPKEDE